LRLQHVSIAVTREGAEQARAFYGGLLGLEERDVLPALDPDGFVWYRAGGDLELHLMLVDDPPPERAHFCLAVDGDLDELRERLEQAGAPTRDTTPLVGRPRFFCQDPFGNLVELARIER
jgi:catechol 2,3-dioxygenase-like lactoylglutathione lyase family enzyme